MTRVFSCRNVCLFAIVSLAPVSGAWAQDFNGLVSMPRVFNDFSTSTLNITNPNTIPGTIIIDDRNMVDDGTGGTFANRHDVRFSGDLGVTPRILLTSEGFTVSANVTLSVGVNAPRKEAGFRIDSSSASGVGDALFIINSDAGEIVAFGGGGPFHSFGNNSGGTGYTPGSTIFMSMTYVPGTGGSAGTLEYQINRGSGIETSGPLPYSNLEGGPVNYQVGVYGQLAPASANDFMTATFGNLTGAIPEPATASIVVCGAALALSGRRVRR